MVKWRFSLHGNFETFQISNGRLGVLDTAVSGTNPATPDAISIRQWFSVLNASLGKVEWRYPGDPLTLGDAFMTADSVYVAQTSGIGNAQHTVFIGLLVS